MKVTATKSFTLHAAHYLPYHQGLCRNMHGHTYQLDVSVTGGIVNGTDPDAGMIIDFGDLKRIVNARIVEHYDHGMLNDYFENPTAELMAQEIWKRLVNEMPQGVFLESIRLWETDTACVEVTE